MPRGAKMSEVLKLIEELCAQEADFQRQKPQELCDESRSP